MKVKRAPHVSLNILHLTVSSHALIKQLDKSEISNMCPVSIQVLAVHLSIIRYYTLNMSYTFLTISNNSFEGFGFMG